MKSITFTKYSKFKITFILLLFCAFASAQDETTADDTSEEKKFDLSGTVDVYYRTNITAPNGEDAIAPGSSFANLDGFALGMANVIASYDTGKVGFVADLVFGPRGSDALFNSPITTVSGTTSTGDVVNQLYVSWDVSDKFKLTLGNFNTFLGYEVISPAGNFNYSTSYLFSYGPFSHAGLKADIDLGNDWTAMVAVMNPTDLTESNTTGDYAIGGQLGYSGQFLNFLYNQGSIEIDYTGGFNLSDAFFLGINAAYFTQEDDQGSFGGLALYPQYKTSDNFTLGLRAEYFTTSDGFGNVAGIGSDPDGDANAFALTLTGSADIGPLTIKPELRIDTTSEDAFVDSDGDPNSSLASFLVAAVYSFD